MRTVDVQYFNQGCEYKLRRLTEARVRVWNEKEQQMGRLASLKLHVLTFHFHHDSAF